MSIFIKKSWKFETSSGNFFLNNSFGEKFIVNLENSYNQIIFD